jgi:hypothetical protein
MTTGYLKLQYYCRKSIVTIRESGVPLGSAEYSFGNASL